MKKKKKLDSTKISLAISSFIRHSPYDSEEKRWNMLEQYNKIFKYLVKVWERLKVIENKIEQIKESKEKSWGLLEDLFLLIKVIEYIRLSINLIIKNLYKYFYSWSSLKSIELELRKRNLNICIFPKKNDKTNIKCFDYRTEIEKKFYFIVITYQNKEITEIIKKKNEIFGTDEELLQILDLETGILLHK